jgi:hypothetical protein
MIKKEFLEFQIKIFVFGSEDDFGPGQGLTGDPVFNRTAGCVPSTYRYDTHIYRSFAPKVSPLAPKVTRSIKRSTKLFAEIL